MKNLIEVMVVLRKVHPNTSRFRVEDGTDLLELVLEVVLDDGRGHLDQHSAVDRLALHRARATLDRDRQLLVDRRGELRHLQRDQKIRVDRLL